jgi:hypothetical protein
MPDQHALALQQADQARTDFALVDSNLEIIMGSSRSCRRAAIWRGPRSGSSSAPQSSQPFSFGSCGISAGHCRGHSRARVEPAGSEGEPIPRGEAGIPTRASLPFHRARKRCLSRLSERPRCPARLWRTRRGFEHAMVDNPRYIIPPIFAMG